MKTPFLTVCIITKNEEKFIGGCISSVMSVADEIIIVDSFSSDKTKTISLKFPVRFFERKWSNDYSAARNYAIDQARGEWILFLDADERLKNSEALIKTLRKKPSKNIGGFLLERRDIYRHKDNQKITHYNVGIVRVFRNKSDIRYRYKIHEQINAPILENGYKINIEKKARIVHLVSDSEDEFLDTKQRYYLKLLNASLKNNPDEPWLNYHKAKTLWYFNQLDKALAIFLSVAKDKSNPVDIRTSSFNQAAVILGILKKYDLAFDLVKKSLRLIPDQSLAYSVKYNLYYDTNQFEKAIAAIKKVKTSIVKCKWQNIIPGDLYVNRDVKYYRIGVCYLAMNNILKARTYFTKGIHTNNESADNYYGLAVLEGYKNNKEKAKQYINKCLKYNSKWEEALALKYFLMKK